MINDLVNFFLGLIDAGSNAADNAVYTGSTAAEEIGGLVLGSLGVGPAA